VEVIQDRKGGTGEETEVKGIVIAGGTRGEDVIEGNSHE